jgi:hypothetical protein
MFAAIAIAELLPSVIDTLKAAPNIASIAVISNVSRGVIDVGDDCVRVPWGNTWHQI